MEILIFIVTLLIPTSLLLIWFVLPRIKDINDLSGYRSKRSKMNQETWDFAQRYAAKLSLYTFFPSLILAIATIPFYFDKTAEERGWLALIIVLIQMISFVVIIIGSESALNKRFGTNQKTR